MLHVTAVLPKGSFVYDPIYAERGKHVHAACHLLDTTGLNWDTVYPPWRGWVEAWEAFKAESGAVVQKSELPLESQKHGYCGRLDCIVKMKRRYVLDIKTGPPPVTTGLQIAAYAEAYKEQYGEPMPGRAVIHLMEDGRYKFTAEDTPGQDLFHPTDFRVFLAYLTTKQWEMNRGLWAPQERKE
jgi:hypothetical protein